MSTATFDAIKKQLEDQRAAKQVALRPELQRIAAMDQDDRYRIWNSYDANNTLFVQRFIESYNPTPFEVLRPDKSYAQLLPINTSKVSAGAINYLYSFTDTIGTTKTIQGSADTTDLPRSDATLTQRILPVQTVGGSFAYTIQELDRAALQAANGLNVQVDQVRRLASFRSHEQTWNENALFGDAAFSGGTTGLFNNASIPSAAAAATGSGSATTWASKNSQNIYNDVVDAYGAVVNASKGVHKTNTLAVPPAQYVRLTTLNMGPEGSITVAELLRKAIPGLNIVLAPELEGRFASSASGFIIYEKSPEVLEFLVAKPYTEQPPQARNLSFEVATTSEFVSGAVIYYPIACAIRTGI